MGSKTNFGLLTKNLSKGHHFSPQNKNFLKPFLELGLASPSSLFQIYELRPD